MKSVFILTLVYGLALSVLGAPLNAGNKPARTECTVDADCTVAPQTECVAAQKGSKSFCMRPRKPVTPQGSNKPARTECTVDADCTDTVKTACTVNKQGDKFFCMKPKRDGSE